MVELTITHSDASTETIPKTVGWTRKREIGGMRRVIIFVDRSDANAVTLTPKVDKIELGSIDALRLVDVETGGPTWRLICYSMEWDANRVEPTDGGNLRAGSDQSLVNGLVGEVSSWSAGTVNSFTGSLSFVFNHAHRHEALRRIERNVPGEIRFRDEGTVDYVDSLGSDKTASVALSASEGNLEEAIRITNRGRELDGTHFRVLGAHEGEAQIYADLVPDDDPASYDNRVDYSTTRWSPGDDPDWDRWVNKDVTDQDTIEEEAAAIGAEIDEGLVEATTTVSGEDLSVGDWVHVEKSDGDLDRDMRIHRITTVQDGASQVDEVLLSTRTTVRRGETHDLEDIQRFNTGFQGSSVVIQGGGGRQPVSSSVNAVESFRYPGVDFENVAEVEVAGLPYRAYSSGAEDNSDFQQVEENSEESGRVTLSEEADSSLNRDWEPFELSGSPVEYTFTNGTSVAHVHVYFEVDRLQIDGSDDDTIVTFSCRLHNTTTGEFFPSEDGVLIRSNGPHTNLESRKGGTVPLFAPVDAKGDTYRPEVLLQSFYSGTTVTVDIDAAVNFIGEGKHTHDPDPGVTEEFPSHPQADASDHLTPSNVDLIINGSTVATNIGTGEFETIIDVSDEFNADAWNTIEAASDSIGHLRLTPYVEAYKQIGAE